MVTNFHDRRHTPPSDELGRSDEEGPQHQVSLSSFWMGCYPVTQEQWKAIASRSPVNRELESDPSLAKGDNLPVEMVSWDDAVEFCDRLSVCTGHRYRLPSEAEWEYACRAGTTTPFYFGETISTDQSNYNGRGRYGEGCKGEYRMSTTPVGIFPANIFGLFDMHGNVCEWCADHFHGNFEGAPRDGSAWLVGETSDCRVIRDGSWVSPPNHCRSASRFALKVSAAHCNLGFRIVRSAENE